MASLRGTANMVRWPPDRMLEQVADPVLQDPVRRQQDRVFDSFGFEIFVDIGIGKAGVSAKIDARDLAAIARHDGIMHTLPAIGAVDVAGTTRAALQIAELIEDEQRMITGAVVVPVPDAVLLFAVRRADAGVHVEQDAAEGVKSRHPIERIYSRDAPYTSSICSAHGRSAIAHRSFSDSASGTRLITRRSSASGDK